MRRGAIVFLACVGMFMVVPPGQLHAKTVYVRDWIVINIRSAPNDASATVAYANTEDQLELTEEADGWSKVRTGDGKEGWVGTRFLTDKPPKGVLFKQLEARNKALQEENARLREAGRSGKSVDGVPPAEGTQGITLPLDVSGEGCAGLKAKYDRLLRENQECVREKNVLAGENSRLKTSERLFFTFIGGVFIVLGVLIGLFIQMVSGRSKKQGYRF
ncbi:MAG: SH3 domain-containing protein [Deltaproteobacteria bacterium ADurb.BinA179]|nr:TIGR04211 family SH3 domain-containing protein [Deltaproteobacteria bacterium]OPZ25352.1 MAG: SH3 domain-containing protein [Deltaproteobacteria bacterium ADurb.BinA179]HOC74899.1 TIGR04211 family SH3 domain-containing protein [Deltaproteobacteria bacterium]HOY76107.1 TIGR04211 family SH3 domain-containing protein [Deltaproteobacteria bacterium]HPA74596.1 TIGR04211 family SH3 domain-containing protein [Deltaproteobacteria bacterium]